LKPVVTGRIEVEGVRPTAGSIDGNLTDDLLINDDLDLAARLAVAEESEFFTAGQYVLVGWQRRIGRFELVNVDTGGGNK
jgi:hypothetical protein